MVYINRNTVLEILMPVALAFTSVDGVKSSSISQRKENRLALPGVQYLLKTITDIDSNTPWIQNNEVKRQHTFLQPK